MSCCWKVSPRICRHWNLIVRLGQGEKTNAVPPGFESQDAACWCFLVRLQELPDTLSGACVAFLTPGRRGFFNGRSTEPWTLLQGIANCFGRGVNYAFTLDVKAC